MTVFVRRPNLEGSTQNAKKYFVADKVALPLAELLSKHLPTINTQAVIESGAAWVHQKRVKNSAQVIPSGTTVIVYVCDTQGDTYEVLASDLVFEDKNVLVVYKPAGIAVGPDRSNDAFNLSYGVWQYFKSKRNDYEPSAITRLDFGVSGLVLFGKHKSAVAQLSGLMQKHRIFKQYIAELPPSDQYPNCLRMKDKIDFQGKAFASSAGKVADSLFIKQSEAPDCSRFSVFIFTGRRHQIRYHAKRYFKPIIGDDLYGKYPGSTALALVAAGLNFFAFGRRYRIRL